MGAVIDGTIDPGFERVRDAFVRNFEEHGDRGATFAVYFGGRRVVDLWGGTTAAGEPYTADTLQVVFSSTKGAVAACAHLLAQRGLLDFDAPVATYWPEFAQAGKDSIPVRWLMTHQAGLPYVDAPLTLDDILAWDPVIAALEQQPPAWEPGTASGYHAVTYGYLVGEVIRRVSGTTVGKLFDREFAQPLDLEFWIGLPEALLPRVTPLLADDAPVDPALVELADRYMGPGTTLGKIGFDGVLIEPFAQSQPDLLQAELPAGNGVTNAASLARLYAGLIGGVDSGPNQAALTPVQIDAARTPQTDGPDWGWATIPGLKVYMPFGLGFMTPSPGVAPWGGERAFGHAGSGGSFGVADPDLGLSMAYVMNQMRQVPIGDPRRANLVRAIYEAIGAAPAIL